MAREMGGEMAEDGRGDGGRWAGRWAGRWRELTCSSERVKMPGSACSGNRSMNLRKSRL